MSKYMQRISNFVFVFGLFSLIIIEGVGIVQSHAIAAYLILVLPLFLVICMYLVRKKIYIPRTLTILYFLFLSFSFISLYFSVNLERSFEYVLMLVGSYLFFLYAYNNKDKASILIKGLIGAGFIFAFFSIIFRFLSLDLSPLFSSIDGNQFVHPLFGSHNHLGDFLLLPILILFYGIIKSKSRIRLPLFLCFLFFFIFFIFSYSKSAYLDLIVVGGGMLLCLKQRGISNLSRRILPFILFVLVVTVSFFLITIRATEQVPFLSSLRFFAQGRQTLSVRSLDSGRVDFLMQGIESISEHPLVGIGPNNFLYASMRHVDLPYWTFTSHNIIIDTAVGQGIIASLILLIFFGFILFKSRKTLPYFLFLAMLFNFQTDYTFMISSFFVLLFVLAGFAYEEKQHISASLLLPVALVLFLAAQAMLFSLVELNKGEYRNAITLYPLQNEAYQPLIKQYLLKGRKKEAGKYLRSYVRYFPGDPLVLEYAGKYYDSYGNFKLAKMYYQKSYNAYRYGDFTVIEKLYVLRLVMDGKKSAKKFADNYFRQVSVTEKMGGLPPGYRIAVSQFCQSIYFQHCPDDPQM